MRTVGGEGASVLAAEHEGIERRRTDRRNGERRGAWRLGFTGASRERLKSVVVVDERHLVGDALAALLRSSGRFMVTSCAAESTDPAAIVAADPDLVVVGVGAMQDSSLQVVEELHRRSPDIRTVIVAESQDPELLRCVMQHGVAALILTTGTGEDLAVTLDQVLRGQTALPAGWQGVLASSDDDPVARLSERQLEVLRLLAEGYRYEEIANRLVITVNTVKFHVRSIYIQLGVGNRMAAARLLEASEPRHVRSISLDANHESG